MSVILLIRSCDLSFANFCVLNPLKVAKERFPFSGWRSSPFVSIS